MPKNQHTKGNFWILKIIFLLGFSYFEFFDFTNKKTNQIFYVKIFKINCVTQYIPLLLSKMRTMISEYIQTFWRRDQKFALQTFVVHILTWTFLLFIFLLWHRLSSTYFSCTQLSFSQFSLSIIQPQLSLTLHNLATHTFASAYFCLSSVFIWNFNLYCFDYLLSIFQIKIVKLPNIKCVRLSYLQQNWVQAKLSQVKSVWGWTIPVRGKLKQKYPNWNMWKWNV